MKHHMKTLTYDLDKEARQELLDGPEVEQVVDQLPRAQLDELYRKLKREQELSILYKRPVDVSKEIMKFNRQMTLTTQSDFIREGQFLRYVYVPDQLCIPHIDEKLSSIKQRKLKTCYCQSRKTK